MSLVISVRLPASLVQRLDEVVDAGAFQSRSLVIQRALERELRRLAAEQDRDVLHSAESSLPKAPPRRAALG